MRHSERMSSPKPSTRAQWLLFAAALVVAAAITAGAPAAPGQRCFANDEGGQVCIDGRMLTFWEQHGGLTAFGRPVTPPIAPSTAGGITVQYFERARLELHPENRAPYDVLLGRIGAEWIDTNGRPAGTEVAAASTGCRAFASTGQRLCGGLLTYWRSHGLRLDRIRTFSERESIALLGLPITPAFVETGASGQRIVTQWLERARLHQYADGTVVAAPLGLELAQRQQQPAQVTPTFVPTATFAPTATSLPTLTPPPPGPTATPVPPPRPAEPIFNVPSANVPCNRNVPAPANGIQLWITDPGDPDGSDQMTACVRVIAGGEAARGASVNLIRHYGAERRQAIAQSTGVDGIASFIFYTGDGSPGTPSQLEAVASFRGVAYRVTIPVR